MTINEFGQVTNNSSDLLLTPTQEEFILSLMDNPMISNDLSQRYAKAIYNDISIPETIYDQTFKSVEDAFNLMATLEWEAQHSPDFDSHDVNVMKALWYYFGQPNWYHYE